MAEEGRRVVVIAVDENEHSKVAFNCKYLSANRR